jgi:hypothetical protein
MCSRPGSGHGWSSESMVRGTDGMPMHCATLCAIMLLSIWHLADEDTVIVVDETGFLKQGHASCGWHGNTRDLRERSRTARSVYFSPMYRAMVTPELIGRSMSAPSCWQTGVRSKVATYSTPSGSELGRTSNCSLRHQSITAVDFSRRTIQGRTDPAATPASPLGSLYRSLVWRIREAIRRCRSWITKR